MRPRTQSGQAKGGYEDIPEYVAVAQKWEEQGRESSGLPLCYREDNEPWEAERVW